MPLPTAHRSSKGATPRTRERVSSHRGPTRRSDNGDAVERILVATEECFQRTGYAGASVREIAERAGVSKSLVLYHFESKERLFAELQLRIYRRLADGVMAAVGSHAGTPVERALLALDSLMASIRERNDLAVHAILSARALSNDALAPHVRHMRQGLRTLLYSTMQLLFGADHERLPVKLEAAADLLWAALTGLALESALDDSAGQLERGLRSLRVLIALAFRPVDSSDASLLPTAGFAVELASASRRPDTKGANTT